MRRAATVFLLFLVATPLVGCSKLHDKEQPAPASSAVTAAATVSAVNAAASASTLAPTATASASAAATEPASAAVATAAANVAATERARQLVSDLRWLVAHNVTQNPAKAGEGDASTKCSSVQSSQKSLGADPNPELKKLLDEAATLCAFDIPLTTAVEALDQLRFSPSQASRKLMCDVATRELERARTIRPRDPRLRSVSARRKEACPR